MRHRSLFFLAALFVVLAPASRRLEAGEPIATIICYHEVDDAVTHSTIPRLSAGPNAAPTEQQRYTITSAAFEEQLCWLRDHDYHVVPLARLVEALEGKGAPLPPRAVVLTSDDGWLCAYTTMLPLLKKFGYPMTFFIYPKIVGHGSHAVTATQLRAMSPQELVEIGSHTFTHPFLSRARNAALSDEAYAQFLHHELVDSREVVSEMSSRPARFLAYPYGDVDEGVVAAVKSAGYEAAVTTERGPITADTSPYRLKRYLVHNDTTLAEFSTFLLPPAPARAGTTKVLPPAPPSP